MGEKQETWSFKGRKDEVSKNTFAKIDKQMIDTGHERV